MAYFGDLSDTYSVTNEQRYFCWAIEESAITEWTTVIQDTFSLLVNLMEISLPLLLHRMSVSELPLRTSDFPRIHINVTLSPVTGFS